MERVASGIRDLDTYLGGGYPKGKGILITGPTGSGKTIFGIHFLYSNCSAGKKGLLILTRGLLEDLVLQSKALGMDLEPFINSGTLLVDNVFEGRIRETVSSSRLGKGLEIREKDRVSQIKILSKGVDVVVQDSLGAFTSMKGCAGEEPFKKFDPIYKILAEHGCTSLFLIDDRAHRQLQGFADYLVFGKIELKLKEDAAGGKFSRYLAVTKMRATELFLEDVRFELNSSGIIIK